MSADARNIKDAMKKIPLVNSEKFALVDDEDFEYLNQWKWYVKKHGNTFYAKRHITPKSMHRLVMNAPDHMEVDHINGDGLLNVRLNLRVCTHSENMRNRGKTKASTSGYKGVFWNKEHKKWVARIKVNGENKHLGYFFDIEQAVIAYNKAAQIYHGIFARINEQMTA